VGFETMIQRAGCVARTRPPAGPLSSRGSQPAPSMLGGRFASPNQSAGLTAGVRGLEYKSFPATHRWADFLLVHGDRKQVFWIIYDLSP
jgi:hypothetical protein